LHDQPSSSRWSFATTQPIELQRAVVDRGQDSTIRLAHVRAVPELALQRKRLDVLEGGAEVALPELKSSRRPGVFDDQRARGQADGSSMRRGVTHGFRRCEPPCEHHFLIGQPIERVRLADAVRTEQGDGASGLQVAG